MTETSPLALRLPASKSHAARPPDDELADLRATQGIVGRRGRVPHRRADTDEELPWDGEASGELQCAAVDRRALLQRPAVARRSSPTTAGCAPATSPRQPEGYIRLVDRTKDLIKSGGEWISSVELENEIMAHPKVAEAAVIGVADPKWGERPLACVVVEDGEELDAGEILEFLDGRVAKWWIPDDVEFIDEVPKTSVGKFSKKALREQFAEVATLDLSRRGAAARGPQPRDAARGLRYDVTPVGLHYLLIHYDIPGVDPEAGACASAAARAAAGAVARRAPGAARGDPRVTMECAGNGRALLEPRAGQPAVAARGGRHRRVDGHAVATVLDEAGVRGRRGRGRVHRPRPGHRGRRASSPTQRSLPLDDAMRRVAARLRGERRAASASTRLPAAAGRARLVRDDQRQVAQRHHRSTSRSTAISRRSATASGSGADDPGTPVTRIMPRSLMVPPGHPRLHDARARRRRRARARSRDAPGRAWAPIDAVEVCADGGATWQDAELGERRRRGPGGLALAWDAQPGEHELCCRARPTPRATSPSRRLEPRRLRQQRRPARPGHRSSLVTRL